MKKAKFSVEKINYALPQVDSGTPVADFCRQLDVCEASLYNLRKKYGKLGLSEVREDC
jgi:putative transposase